ncbi:MAG: BLUF domain-containing protein [Burkholderiaceae bacterium]
MYEVIYSSRLAPGAPITAVSDIVGRARRANAPRGITGLLVFDGLRFCQALEGPQLEVLTLMAKIKEDERHTGVSVLHHGSSSVRRFERFRTGYTPADQPNLLVALEGLEGPAAAQAVAALVPLLDLDP